MRRVGMLTAQAIIAVVGDRSKQTRGVESRDSGRVELRSPEFDIAWRGPDNARETIPARDVSAEEQNMDRRTFLAATAAAGAAAGTVQAADAPRKLRVAIIGCGRMGQYFAEVYRRLPQTELVVIAEWNDDRRAVVGERFGVKALFKDVNAMVKSVVPDMAAIITPTRFMKEAVIRCAEAGVKGISTDKPMASRLSDADAMVDACKKSGAIFAGGNLQRAKWEVQHAARRIRAGEFGRILGAAVHGYGGEISGGGCQHMSVLRLFTGAEVEEVMAWGSPPEALLKKDDGGLNINGKMRLSTVIDCQVFGVAQKYGDQRNRSGVDVWCEDGLVSWQWAAPKIYSGLDARGRREEIDPEYPAFPWADVLAEPPLRKSDDYLLSSIQAFIKAVQVDSEAELFVSGHDLRQALEIAIACKQSAVLGNLPVQLPLADRSLFLDPSPYRLLGGDQTGNVQSSAEAAGKKKPTD